jgi:hypothetical protein
MAVQQARLGTRMLIVWDGEILEVFGALRASGSRRFHPAVAEMVVKGPDKKGRMEVLINSHDANVTLVPVEADEVARVQPIIDAFAAAIAAAQG